ncbi:MAG: hypothetical protein IKI31_06380 [Treponema sp.]|nr:hypothetical protein [Treponema sp.]
MDEGDEVTFEDDDVPVLFAEDVTDELATLDEAEATDFALEPTTCFADDVDCVVVAVEGDAFDVVVLDGAALDEAVFAVVALDGAVLAVEESVCDCVVEGVCVFDVELTSDCGFDLELFENCFQSITSAKHNAIIATQMIAIFPCESVGFFFRRFDDFLFEVAILTRIILSHFQVLENTSTRKSITRKSITRKSSKCKKSRKRAGLFTIKLRCFLRKVQIANFEKKSPITILSKLDNLPYTVRTAERSRE